MALAAWGLVATLAAAAGPGAQLAIVIDDLGYDPGAARRVAALAGPLTAGILPDTPASRTTATLARAAGHEVLVHLPMQSREPPELGRIALTLGQDELTVTRSLDDALTAVPGARGLSNHMGSALTADTGAMRTLMLSLHMRGALYFLDSRTDPGSVAERTACEYGVPFVRRDVFLDHDPDPAAIAAALAHAAGLARTRGHAVAIGHPYPATLAVLEARLPELTGAGVTLVPVSALVTDPAEVDPWPTCSSRSPPVAKKSRP